jgi:hypothetical protein
MTITKEQYKEIEENAEKYLQYWREQNVSYTLPDITTIISLFKYQQYGE